MKNQVFIYVSAYSDPFKNLAMENHLLESLKAGQRALLFYINKPCVVMGRFQNPWYEINVKEALVNNVTIVRRQSGGGCVYHDEGNLNFCFMTANREIERDENYKILTNAFENFDLKIKREDDTNLFIGPNKISGSAFKQKRDRSFHHGTLLINSNLENLNYYIKRQNYSIELTRGIKSNPKNVANLIELNKDITIKNLIEVIAKSFAEFFALDFSLVHDFRSYDQSYYQSLVDQNWLWGETPLFNIKLNSIEYKVHKNIILEVNGDCQNEKCGCFFSELFNELHS